MKYYSSFLFDADGTLIDTMDMIVRCFENTFAKFGKKTISKKDIMKNVGLPLRTQLEEYLGSLSDERFTEMAEVHMAYQLKIYPSYLKIFPGVAEGLAKLKSAGKQCAIVTSRRRDTLDLYLKETGIYDYFDAFVTPETTLKHKPDPEPALAALSALTAEKNEALLIGDSTFDIECAFRAGVDSAFVKWSSNDPAELAVQPTFFIDNVSQLDTLERKTVA